MKPISVLYYAIAMFFPLILFIGILENANEKGWLAPALTCGVLWAGAGLLAVPGKLKVDGDTGGKIKWVGLSALFGVIEGVAMYALV
jgi:hypothetical protein